MVLALKFHRHHVRPGVGRHFVTPNDPGAPGACRRGGTASGWGRVGGGGNGQLGPCWSGGRWGPAGRDGQGAGSPGKVPSMLGGVWTPESSGLGLHPRPRPQRQAGPRPSRSGALTCGPRRQREDHSHGQQQATPLPCPGAHGSRRPAAPSRAQRDTAPTLANGPGRGNLAVACGQRSARPRQQRPVLPYCFREATGGQETGRGEQSERKGRWLERPPAGDKPGSVGS